MGLFVATHLECWVGRRYRYLRHNLPHHRTHPRRVRGALNDKINKSKSLNLYCSIISIVFNFSNDGDTVMIRVPPALRSN